MRKASITIYFIFGLLVLILLALFLSQKPELTKDNLYSEDMSAFQKYFDECALYSIIRSNVLNGFISNSNQYQGLIEENIDSCMQPFLDSLQLKGFNINKKGLTSSKLEVNDKTLVVSIKYPIEISKEGMKFEFEEFTKTFERSVEINLEDLSQETILSEDGLLKIELEKGTKLTDMYGNPSDKLLVLKIFDKKEKDGEILESNIIYGLLPIKNIATKPIKLCFYISDLLPNNNLPISKLKVAWYNPHSNNWGYLDSIYEKSCLTTEINYTTFYGIIEAKDFNYPPGVTMLDNTPDNTDEQNDLVNSISGNPVPPTYKILPGNGKNWEELFNQINQEMGGPYNLMTNPQCTSAISGNAYCLVGSAKNNCEAAVNCKSEGLNKMTQQEQNMLFRHEIVHSIQMNNDPSGSLCPPSSTQREWGAEYYSGTGCYSFNLNGNTYDAKGLTQYIQDTKPQCSDDLFLNAAFCKKGSYDALESNGCLLGKGKNIADSHIGQKCIY